MIERDESIQRIAAARDHHLELLDAAEKAESSTPFVIFHIERVRANARRFRIDVEGVRIHVAAAVKACYVPGVHARLVGAVDHFDAQSAHEADLLCPRDAPLSYHGPILDLPHRPVDWISFNSDAQWRAYDFGAAPPGRRHGIRISLAEGLDKFGVDDPRPFLGACPASPFVHGHADRRLDDPAQAARTARRLAEHVAGTGVATVNLGGGYDGLFEMRLAGTRLEDVVHAQVGALRAALPSLREVIVEPGRALFEDAAVAVTTVREVVERPNGRVVVVDIASNLLSPLPNARYLAFPLAPSNACHVPTSVVDGTCRARGVVSALHLPDDVRPGHRLAVVNVGAYTYSFASEFFAPIPRAFSVEGEPLR